MTLIKEPLSDNAISLLEKRYLQPGETPDDMFWRVARAVAQGNEQWATRYYSMMTNLDFLPNSPTLMNAGGSGTLSACYVLPLDDSINDIFETLKQAALVTKSAGGVGFSFSRLRPRNDDVQTAGGVASGAVSFMRNFNAMAETVKQGGKRRAAMMSNLRVDHPDILEFIDCKSKDGDLNNFNISVAITDAFMEAVKTGSDYALYNPRTGQETGRLSAREVWNRIAKAAHANGEPGLIFIDTINRNNPVPYLGAIEATNPCGEQPLASFGSCTLGSINLARFVKDNDVDWTRLSSTIHMAVRFLDDVLDVNQHPLPQISARAESERRIGLGVMGWADMLMQLGLPYGSTEAVELAEKLGHFLHAEAHAASCHLASQRGAFPAYREPGTPRRNATLTTVAPTGSTSFIAGCSSGIEPAFALAYTRKTFEGDEYSEVNPHYESYVRAHASHPDEILEQVKRTGKQFIGLGDKPGVWLTAQEITPEQHIAMQAAWQRNVDSGVSKTINLPSSAGVEDVTKAYQLAYDLGCKGVTVYRDGSRENQVLSIKKEEKVIKPRTRPTVLSGTTEKVRTVCGTIYVTVNGGPDELFSTFGKAGGCLSAWNEAVARLVSLALRAGVDSEEVIRQLKGIRCPNPAMGPHGHTSCPDAIARVLERVSGQVVETSVSVGGCPECGTPLNASSGCLECPSCGYGRCG